MDFLLAALAGVIFSVLSTAMIFLLIRNAKKGIVNNYVYILPCFSMVTTFLSALRLAV